ncbi:hydroxymethylglutaryl-CoA synthase [Enterococcus camelliae]|uniref:Hydroxymethylglutaryl-CoA synthase n=1 Tax=Enterococcus camelliae TaxID=453959 RepID=A0ABW5TM42_9ENTE
MLVGIDQLSFYAPPFYVDMAELADARGVDPNKYLIGIGQTQMSVAPKTQDIVTFAANAAKQILTPEIQKKIDMIIVGTESSLDESKASAVVLHRLLGLNPFTRAFEIKQACYGATAGIQIAVNHLAAHPESNVLVIATDNARYGLNSGGEPTQGAGAVAILLSANPRILALTDETVTLTQDIYDFWRPTGNLYPEVDGPLSNQTYIDSFQKTWDEYEKRYTKTFTDFAALCFHVPYTKMGKKALLAKLADVDADTANRLLQRYEESIHYSKRIGNLYTGSLYLGLISLLETSVSLKAGDKIGLFSYGSGSVAEFFTGHLIEGYEKHLKKESHESLLNKRKKLSITDYEHLFNDTLDISHNRFYQDSQIFSISEVKDLIRHYKQ